MAAPKKKFKAKRSAAQGPAAPRDISLRRDPESGVVVTAREDDVGTAERWRQGQVEVRRHYIHHDSRTISNRKGAIALDESLFDRMVAKGVIHDPAPNPDSPAAEHRREVTFHRRRAAATWLAELHHKAGMAPSVSGKYSHLSTRGRTAGDGGSEDISDEEAWNRRCLHDMWRAIPRAYADILFQVICQQEIPRGVSAKNLRNALDALAKWRGF